jgi:ribose 5-phosphate isomerase B
MTYYIGSDHTGIGLKKFIKKLLEKKRYNVIDLGPVDTSRVDYPDFAKKVCQEVQKHRFSKGILICGSGIGMSMAANKFEGIRAALCHNVYSATMAIQHNDANVLCMGERVSGYGMIEAIIDAWDNNIFKGGRHEQRVDKINNLYSCKV